MNKNLAQASAFFETWQPRSVLNILILATINLSIYKLAFRHTHTHSHIRTCAHKMTDPLAKGHVEEGALEIHTNVLDLIIIKFICMVMCFKWSLLPTNDKQSTNPKPESGAETESETESGLPNEKCQYPLFKWVLRTALSVGLETGRQTAGTQTLAESSWPELSWVPAKSFESMHHQHHAHIPVYVTVMLCAFSCLLFVICCAAAAAGRIKWPKGCSPGSRRRILHSGPLQSNDES